MQTINIQQQPFNICNTKEQNIREKSHLSKRDYLTKYVIAFLFLLFYFIYNFNKLTSSTIMTFSSIQAFYQKLPIQPDNQLTQNNLKHEMSQFHNKKAPISNQSQKSQQITIKQKFRNLQTQNDKSNTTNIPSTPASSGVQKYVLLIIIIFFVGVPILATIIFIILVIIKKCTQDPNPQQATQIQNVQSQINLQQYNIDQIGPYHLNPQDQCVICLDKKPNLRTFCGHLFHSTCLRTWFKKKSTTGGTATCPVCVSQETNPVKVYCTECYAACKLDKLSVFTSRVVTAELQIAKCEECMTKDGKMSQQFTEDQKSVKQEKNNVQNNKIQNNIGNQLKSAEKLVINNQI